MWVTDPANRQQKCSESHIDMNWRVIFLSFSYQKPLRKKGLRKGTPCTLLSAGFRAGTRHTWTTTSHHREICWAPICQNLRIVYININRCSFVLHVVRYDLVAVVERDNEERGTDLQCNVNLGSHGCDKTEVWFKLGKVLSWQHLFPLLVIARGTVN